MRSITIAVGLLAALMCGGCSRPATADGARLTQASAALKSAGVALDGLANVDATRFAAARCIGGLLAGVDAVLCEYGSGDAAALGKKAGEDWVGQAPTGLVLERDRALLMLADRTRADPNGRQIHKMAQAFRAIP